jgi:hypothetical protein
MEGPRRRHLLEEKGVDVTIETPGMALTRFELLEERTSELTGYFHTEWHHLRERLTDFVKEGETILLLLQELWREWEETEGKDPLRRAAEGVITAWDTSRFSSGDLAGAVRKLADALEVDDAL